MGICFQNENRKPAFIPPEILAGLFEQAVSDGLETVVLNACYTAAQSEAISQHVKYVVAMEGLVGDAEAINFTKAFYTALTRAKSVEFAFRQAKNNIPVTGNAGRCKPLLMGLNASQVPVKVSNHEPIALESSAIKLIEANKPEEESLADGGIDEETLESLEKLEVAETQPPNEVRAGRPDSAADVPQRGTGTEPSQPTHDQPKAEDLADAKNPRVEENLQVVRGPGAATVNVPARDILRTLAQDKTFKQLVIIRQREPRSFQSVIQQLAQGNSVVIRKMLLFRADIIGRLLEGNDVESVIREADGPLLDSISQAEASTPRGPRRTPVPQRQQLVPSMRVPFSSAFFDAFFSDPFHGFGSVFRSTPSRVLPPQRPGTQPPRVVNSVTCNRCNEPFSMRGGYHCEICNGGDFDVCVDCVANNMGCLNVAHVLEKWVIKS
ncbi:uncharacterized protein PG986_003559 [Apiospora aurea]|uniref:ZZ-type domain-containing protein n=1 Tax=Apiospora aurea TaxID=335848 RepID=A0ABR1QS25_9PEZI